MNNAEASINMEGLQVTPTAREMCERVLRKEMSPDEYIRAIVAKARAEDE